MDQVGSAAPCSSQASDQHPELVASVSDSDASKQTRPKRVTANEKPAKYASEDAADRKIRKAVKTLQVASPDRLKEIVRSQAASSQEASAQAAPSTPASKSAQSESSEDADKDKEKVEKVEKTESIAALLKPSTASSSVRRAAASVAPSDAEDDVARQLRLMAEENDRITVRLRQHNLARIKVAGDGNCFFACVALAIYNDPLRHPEIRNAACDYLQRKYFVTRHWDDVKLHVQEAGADSIASYLRRLAANKAVRHLVRARGRVGIIADVEGGERVVGGAISGAQNAEGEVVNVRHGQDCKEGKETSDEQIERGM